ncbi:hypothetical protein L6R50_01480 [Myxococcota bacterium]|nr:hypothetical protein [Myxococcota bacterium]
MAVVPRMLRHALPVALLAAAAFPGCGPACDDPLTTPFATVSDGLPSALISIQGLSADDVWTVGSDAGSPAVYHYDGSAWEKVETGTVGDLWWVHPTSSRVTMVGAGGTILEMDRDSGETVPVDGVDPGITFFGVWGANEDDVWAVGGGLSGGTGPALWHRDAGGWSAVDLSSFGFAGHDLLYKVHGTSSSDAWIVGTGGTILHYDGAAWTRVDSPTSAVLFTVHAGGPFPVAVGGANQAVILHYEGGSWLDHSPEFQPTVNGVSGRGDMLIATGAQGSIHRWDGEAWVTDASESISTLTLHGAWVDDEEGLWVVGGQLSAPPLDQGIVYYAGCRDVPGLQ